MTNNDLNTGLQIAKLEADSLRRRLCSSGFRDGQLYMAMGKEIYYQVALPLAFTMSEGTFGYWMGYRICLINENAYKNCIFPIFTNDVPIDSLNSCSNGDKMVFLDECDGGAESAAKVFIFNDSRSVHGFIETDMTVTIYPVCGTNGRQAYPTEQEVDSFLNDYIQS